MEEELESPSGYYRVERFELLNPEKRASGSTAAFLSGDIARRNSSSEEADIESTGSSDLSFENVDVNDGKSVSEVLERGSDSFGLLIVDELDGLSKKRPGSSRQKLDSRTTINLHETSSRFSAEKSSSNSSEEGGYHGGLSTTRPKVFSSPVIIPVTPKGEDYTASDRGERVVHSRSGSNLKKTVIEFLSSEQSLQGLTPNKENRQFEARTDFSSKSFSNESKTPQQQFEASVKTQTTSLAENKPRNKRSKQKIFIETNPQPRIGQNQTTNSQFSPLSSSCIAPSVTTKQASNSPVLFTPAVPLINTLDSHAQTTRGKTFPKRPKRLVHPSVLRAFEVTDNKQAKASTYQEPSSSTTVHSPKVGLPEVVRKRRSGENNEVHIDLTNYDSWCCGKDKGAHFFQRLFKFFLIGCVLTSTWVGSLYTFNDDVILWLYMLFFDIVYIYDVVFGAKNELWQFFNALLEGAYTQCPVISATTLASCVPHHILFWADWDYAIVWLLICACRMHRLLKCVTVTQTGLDDFAVKLAFIFYKGMRSLWDFCVGKTAEFNDACFPERKSSFEEMELGIRVN